MAPRLVIHSELLEGLAHVYSQCLGKKDTAPLIYVVMILKAPLFGLLIGASERRYFKSGREDLAHRSEQRY
jgi:hypothetical protein